MDDIYGVTIQMKPLQQYCHMVLFTSHVVLTFESVDEILWCYHSNETSSAVFSHDTNYLVCSCNFWVCEWNPIVLPFKWNLVRSTFTWYYLFFSILKKKIGKFSGIFTLSTSRTISLVSCRDLLCEWLQKNCATQDKDFLFLFLNFDTVF